MTDQIDQSHEPIMLNVIRRRLLAALPSMLLTPLPWSRASAPNAKAGPNNGSFHDRDYPQGCIFAKTRNLHSVFEGGLPTSSIDFWTFRVSEIDANDLPANIGKVVVWDDVFSSRHLHRQVGEIIEAVRKYYRFDIALSSEAIGFHLENFSEIGPTIAKMLSITSVVPSSVRIALIDIESCGVSRLDWPDILPHLRTNYDLVVGFAHFSGGGPMHWRAVFGEDIDRSNTWTAVAHCDLSFLTSDALLGFSQIPDCDARQPHLNAMLQRLVQALSTTGFLHTVAGAGAPFFCIATLPLQSPGDHSLSKAVERQRRLLCSEFSDRDPELPIVFAEQDRRAAPIMNEGLSIWPLRQRAQHERSR